MCKGILFTLLLILNVIFISNGDDKKEDIFIPSHEWQIVHKGQKIPKGLHVRINFETGVTEAKLMDEESKDRKALMEVPANTNTFDDAPLNLDIIKDTLKKIRGDDILSSDEIPKTKKFRSYDVLKEEMDSLNLIPKIDAEVLRDLFKQHNEEIKKQNIHVPSVLRILEDFDFLAHQYDNGIEFVQQQGFQKVIYRNLNMSDNQLKKETLKLFGSLVQNNGKVQIHVLETNGLNVLLKLLNFEQSVDVKSRAIYALSCLLRRFPLAQLRFVENGGLSVALSILKNDPIKIQIKLVTLINDLLLENIQAMEDKDNENYNMLVSQYQLVNLEGLLLEQNWCQYLNNLLYLLVATDEEDHDSIEKCILSMHSIGNKCSKYYSQGVLSKLEEKYKTLALTDLDKDEEFNNSDFFTNLHLLCRDILNQKNVKTEL